MIHYAYRHTMSSHNFLTLKVPTLADIDWKCPRWQGLERNRLAAICKKTCHPKHSKHFRNLAKTWYKSFLEQLLRPLACFFSQKKRVFFPGFFRWENRLKDDDAIQQWQRIWSLHSTNPTEWGLWVLQYQGVCVGFSYLQICDTM